MKKINLLLITFLIVEIVTIIIGNIIGTSFYFCLKPFIYVLLVYFVYIITDNKYIVKKHKKLINQYVIMAIIAYMLLYILSGIIFGFSYNPLVMKDKLFYLNFLYYVPSLISIELLRYRMVSLFNKEKRFKYTIILCLIFSLSMSNITFAMFNDLESIIRMFYELIFPNFVIGCFLAYINLKANLIVAVLYVLIPLLFSLFSPILPNPEWIVVVLLKTVIPIIFYAIISDLDKAKEKKELKRNNIYINIFYIMLMNLIILFSVGIFRFYPVAIASNSMQPSFSRYDIQVIDKKKIEYQIGDVIQFYGIDNTIFVHRIVDKRKDNNKVYYTTKGDNNEYNDIIEVSEDMIIGKSIFTIKYLGYPTVILKEKF